MDACEHVSFQGLNHRRVVVIFREKMFERKEKKNTLLAVSTDNGPGSPVSMSI